MNNKDLDIQIIIDVVCRYFKIDKEMLYLSKNHKKPKRCISLARYYILYISHIDYGVSISRLSKEFSLTTRGVFLGISKLKSWINMYPSDEIIYNELILKLKEK